MYINHHILSNRRNNILSAYAVLNCNIQQILKHMQENSSRFNEETG